jgi:hypothetical protein
LRWVLDRDTTGSRRLVYQVQAMQEIVASANTNGHNTVLFMPTGGGSAPVLMPITQTKTVQVQAPASDKNAASAPTPSPASSAAK